MTAYLASQVFPLKLNKTTAFILMALCDSAEDDGSRCFPSPQYVAWKTGCGKSTVYRVIEELVAAGILEEMGLYGTTMEYTVHLENAPLKTPWQRRRIGRPRQSPDKEKSSQGGKHFPQRENIPTDGNISHSGKSRPTVGKIFPQREKSSQGGKASLAAKGSKTREKSGTKAGGEDAEPSLYNLSYLPKLIDSAHPSPNQGEKEEGASPPHHPDVSPITEVRRDVGDTPSPPIAPPPLSPAPSTWRVIRAEMEPVLSPVQRREWLDRLEFFHIEGDEWAIVTPTQYAAEFVENRWGGHFRAALHHAAGPDASLSFVYVPKGKVK